MTESFSSVVLHRLAGKFCLESMEVPKNPQHILVMSNAYTKTSIQWENKGANYWSYSWYWDALSRKEYFGEPVQSNHRWLIHNIYYGQKAFVTKDVVNLVLELGSPHFFKGKYDADEHFNNIELSRWDELASRFPSDVIQAIRDSGCRGVSLACKVCVLKAAARMIACPNKFGTHAVRLVYQNTIK